MIYSDKNSAHKSKNGEIAGNKIALQKFTDQRISANAQLKQQQQMRLAYSPNVIQQLNTEEPLQGKFETEAPAQLQEVSAEKPDNTGLPNQARSGAETVQREVKCFRDETGKVDMGTLAGNLNTCVTMAKTIVDANPLLQGVSNRGDGYLGAWVNCFNEYLSSGEIPAFFYARYGYAIETLATLFFKSQGHLGYKVENQETYGSTRPDFVIRSGSTDVAWLDITSSASAGHIFSKQGGGWNSRPYVAEILYDMPDPASFTVSAKGQLTIEQLEQLEKADKSRALRVQQFDIGMKKMSLLLGNAYAEAYAQKGSGLSRENVKEATRQTCKAHLDQFLDGGVKPQGYIGVLASIDFLEVTGEINTGVSWANWAFGSLGDQSLGRALLLSFGKPKEEPKKEEPKEGKEGGNE